MLALSRRHTDVTAWVEAPALGLDLAEGRDLAQSRHINVVPGLAESFLHQREAALEHLGGFAPIEPYDVRQEFDLLGREIAVRPVDLAVDVAGVDEQHLVPALLGLATIQEPERAGQSHGIEEVRADRYDDIDRAALD